MAALASDWLRHIRLLLWNCCKEFNETWQEVRSHCPLSSLRFSGRLEKQDGRPGLWLADTFLTSPLKLLKGIQRNLTGSKIPTSSTKFVFFGLIRSFSCWSEKQDGRPGLWLAETYSFFLWNCFTEFNETWQEVRSQCLLSSLCFSGRSEKQDGCPGLWLAETFWTSPLKRLNGIQRNLTGRKITTPSTKFVFFQPIGITRWPLWPLIGWDIFDFSSETAARNSTKLDRKLDLIVLYQVCIFRADWKNRISALASDWLRHFWLLLWNCWKEFNETWQEARSQHPLPSLCFSGWSEKQDGRPGLWLAETYSFFPLKLLHGIQRNLTGSKISMSSIKFVFFGPIGKTRWPPWPLIGWDIFDFSSETAEQNSTKLDRKQDLKVLYQVGRSEKQDGLPGLWWAETFSASPLKLLNGIQQNLTGSKISVSSSKFVFFGSVRKTRWPPQLLTGWDIFDFSSETAEGNSMKVDRNRWTEFNKSDSKQDFNIFYQVCVFRADELTKMADLSKRWHIVLRCTLCGPLGLLFLIPLRGQIFDAFSVLRRATVALRASCLGWSGKSTILVFVMLIRKKDGRPGLWLAETFSTSSLKALNGIQWNLTGSTISTSSTISLRFLGWSEKKALLASD